MKRLTFKGDLFVCKVATDETQANGNVVKTKRTYGIDALSWGDAEKKILELLAPYGEVEILDIKKPRYAEVYTSEKDSADKWYCVSVEIITIDEYRNKEKRTPETMLFQAESLDEASKMAEEALGDTMLDYDKHGIKDSGIFDILEG